MDRPSYDTTPGGRNAATAAPVRASVALPAVRFPQRLRRSLWSATAAAYVRIDMPIDMQADMTCGFATDMKVHERWPEEGSS